MHIGSLHIWFSWAQTNDLVQDQNSELAIQLQALLDSCQIAAVFCYQIAVRWLHCCAHLGCSSNEGLEL